MSNAKNGVAHSQEWANSSISGAGIGLRNTHVDEILLTRPNVPWFEVLADNHIARGGLIPAQLKAIRQQYPLTFHCVGMSLAGTDPLDMDYLKIIKRMVDETEPAWVSDHLCFTRFGQHHSHDLLPIPYTIETLKHVSERIDQVQNILGQRVLIENVSSYLEFEQSDLTEAQFLAELLGVTDCQLLLDLNNVYVSAQNHNFNSLDYLDVLPLEMVQEIHLAGYDDRGDYLLDAHNNKVSEPVWSLYEYVIKKIPNVATLIEWDNDLPEFSVLLGEAKKAMTLREQRLGE
ncbi:MAG: hypothetical protein ACJA13_002981 [Paraglaciecola sp.]|jgi:uncharacterized protein (UPF0276 family)